MVKKGLSLVSLILVMVIVSAFVPSTGLNAVPLADTTKPTSTKVPTAEPTPTPPFPVGPGGKIPLGVVLPNSSTVFSQAYYSGYLKKFGYSATILFSQNNPKQEIKNIQTLISQKIKVLILCPVEPWNANVQIDIAKVSGIKIIIADRFVTNSNNEYFYVGFNNLDVGKLQAQYLVDHISGTGVPLYLYAGNASDPNAVTFFEGAWNVLQPKIADGTFVVANSSQVEKLKNISVLQQSDKNLIFNQIAIKDWDPNNARNLAKTQLKNATESKKGDVAILAPNDDTARVISDIFRSDKDIKSYLITGQDAKNASFSYIRSSRQSMTIVKDPQLLATTSIDVALKFLADQVPSSVTINNGRIDIPTRYVDLLVVDKSNVNSVKPIW